MNNTYILIMAGGEGTRFVPFSTPECPKQFLNFVGEGTFIQQTRRRVTELAPAERIFVATNERYVSLVHDQLPDIPKKNIIAEPAKKNTAPCIAYAAKLIHGRDPDATMVVLPSDHVILRPDCFLDAIRLGIDHVQRSGELVTLGITPTWSSTDYGYIQTSTISPECHCEELFGKLRATKPAYRQAGNPLKMSMFDVHRVSRFVEKPNSATAGRYISEGNYYWNSGMFIWKTSAILAEIAKHLPDMHCMLNDFEEGEKFRNHFFHTAQSVSIDYGVMEKAECVSVIPCDLGWSDVGTWESLHRLSREALVTITPDVLATMREVLGHVLPKEISGEVRKVDKPWGHEEIWAHTGDYVGKILVINKLQRLSYQYHRVKEETIRILEGVMDLEFEVDGTKKIVRLNQGDVFHIPPRTKHRMIAVENCRVLEVSTPYLNDVVRVEDDFGR